MMMRTRVRTASSTSYTLQARSRNTVKPTIIAMAAVVSWVRIAIASDARARLTFEQIVEPRLSVSRARASLAMAILTQLTTAAIAMIVGFTVFRDRAWSVYEVLEAVLSLVLIIIVFHRLLPFVLFSRTQGRWLAHWTLLLRLLIYLVLPITLALGFCQSVD